MGSTRRLIDHGGNSGGRGDYAVVHAVTWKIIVQQGRAGSSCVDFITKSVSQKTHEPKNVP